MITTPTAQTCRTCICHIAAPIKGNSKRHKCKLSGMTRLGSMYACQYWENVLTPWTPAEQEKTNAKALA